MSAVLSIRVAAIEIGDRLRQADPNWVDALAAMIREDGLEHPIGVVETEPGYRLVFGLHRLLAVRALELTTVEARVYPPGTTDADITILRRREILENIGRRELSALDRMAHLAELKAVHDGLQPERRGRPSKNTAKLAGISFAAEAAEKTGLSERAIYRAAAIYSGLAPETRARVAGTRIAESQSDLTLLSEASPEEQARALDILLAQAGTVADAITLAQGRRPESAADRQLLRVRNGFERLPERQKDHLFAALEDQFLAWRARHGRP